MHRNRISEISTALLKTAHLLFQFQRYKKCKQEHANSRRKAPFHINQLHICSLFQILYPPCLLERCLTPATRYRVSPESEHGA